MDRLKGSDLQTRYNAYAHLHSSMDRLKAASCSEDLVTVSDLHSSMDRLKVKSRQPSQKHLILFTFQYG